MVSYVVYDNEADFYDIYYASCLNGWTMGDLAVAPSDITRFYYYLFGSEVMGPGSESVCVPLRGRLLAPMLSFISSRPDTRAGCPTMVPPPPRCHRTEYFAPFALLCRWSTQRRSGRWSSGKRSHRDGRQAHCTASGLCSTK